MIMEAYQIPPDNIQKGAFKMKKWAMNFSVSILSVFVIMLFAYQANGGIAIFLKDGNVIQVPVNKEDIMGISFEESTGSSGYAVPSSTMPVSSGLFMWLDSSDMSSLFQSADGTNPVSAGNQLVGLWRDKSGNDNHFMQTGAAARPNFVKTGIGGKASIVFEPGQSMLVRTNFPAPVTVIYVARQLGGTNNRILSAVANNWLLGFWSGAKNQAYYDGWVSPSGSPPADTLPHVFIGIVKGRGQNSEVWADGVLIANNQNGIAGPNGLAINTGAFAGEVSNCQVAEIAVFNRDLTPVERQKVETHLKSKWGISR
jgi:hypothetical protein